MGRRKKREELIVGLDPGAISGYARMKCDFDSAEDWFGVVEKRKELLALEFGDDDGGVLEQAEGIASCLETLSSHNPDMRRVLVIEKFIGSAKSLRGGALDEQGGGGQFVAVEVAWAVLGYLAATGEGIYWEVVWLTAADAAAVKPEHLRGCGLWIKGRDHKRSAARLAARYVQKRMAEIDRERSRA